MDIVYDFENIITTFLKIIKGKDSANSISTQLGHSFNLYSRWENNSKVIYWNDLLQLSELRNIPLLKNLNLMFNLDFKALPESPELLSGILSNDEFSKVVLEHFSYQKIKRLEAGDSKLSLKDFLLIIELVYGKSERFVSTLIPQDQVSAILEVYGKSGDYSRYVSCNPKIAIVRMCLALTAYKELPEHDSGFIANLVGMTAGEVDTIMKILEEVQMVEKPEKHFVTSSKHVENLVSGKEVALEISNRWRNVISEHAKDKLRDGRHQNSYVVYPTNTEIEKDVYKLASEFMNNLRNLIRNHPSNEQLDTIRVINLDHFVALENWSVIDGAFPR